MLSGERLVARLDLKADRRMGVLRVLSCRFEETANSAPAAILTLSICRRAGTEADRMASRMTCNAVTSSARRSLESKLLERDQCCGHPDIRRRTCVMSKADRRRSQPATHVGDEPAAALDIVGRSPGPEG